jgi:autotransporter-associated beta strand protein
MLAKNVQVNQQLQDVSGLVLTGNSGALLSNYNPLSIANTSISITPKSVTIMAPNVSKTYDASAVYNASSADLIAMATPLVGGDSVTSASTQFTTVTAGSNKTLQLLSVVINDGNNGNNYSVTLQNSTNNTINKATLTVAAANDGKFVTQTDAVGSANNCGTGVTCLGGYAGLVINGFVNGETVATLSGTPTISRINALVNSAAVYPGVLQPSGYTSANYTINYVNGDYTIVPAQQLLVKVIPQTITYGNNPSYGGQINAKYLASDNTTIVNLVPVVTGSQVSLNDGVGGTAVFTLSPQGAGTSTAGFTKVGAYDLVTNNAVTTGTNFSNNLVIVGTLTISPITMTIGQLGVTGVSKTYDGNSSITGLALQINSNTTRLLSNDVVNVIGTGTFNDQNVGLTNKPVNLNVALTGADASNYALTSTALNANIGTISQLASVTYVGPSSGGNWSNSANWLGGATPTLSNVAEVIIPVGKSVVYDSPAVGTTTSTIVANGVLGFSSASNFTLANNVSGSGSMNLTGSGTLTLSGNNTFTGGVNINSSPLNIASVSALGTAPVTSSGGSISVQPGLTLSSLTVNGAVKIASDISTTGAQSYNGAVTIAAGSSLAGVQLTTANGNITFNSTLNSDAGNRSLIINAGTGTVLFGDKVGNLPLNYAAYSANGLGANLYDLSVQASRIVIKGDIQTLDAQIYRGAISISDNGTNGLTRNLISVDPSITFTTTIDDVAPNTHSLYISAASLTAATNSNVDFQQGVAAVGSLIPLLYWEVHSGMQDATPTAFMGAIAPGPTGTITSNGTALPTGSYMVNSIPVNTNSMETTLTNPNSLISIKDTNLEVPIKNSTSFMVAPKTFSSTTKSFGDITEATLTSVIRDVTLAAYERAFRAEVDESRATVVICKIVPQDSSDKICDGDI